MMSSFFEAALSYRYIYQSKPSGLINISMSRRVYTGSLLFCSFIKGCDNIKIVIDNNIIDKYNETYFKMHPRATKKPITHPWHPSINEWCILPRIQMNNLKQKWKDFGCWLIKYYGYTNLQLDSFDIIITVFFNTKRRHDVDNQTPKFLLDAFTCSGFIVDDDEKHLHSLTLKTGYDKSHPRTEIDIITN